MSASRRERPSVDITLAEILKHNTDRKQLQDKANLLETQKANSTDSNEIRSIENKLRKVYKAVDDVKNLEIDLVTHASPQVSAAYTEFLRNTSRSYSDIAATYSSSSDSNHPSFSGYRSPVIVEETVDSAALRTTDPIGSPELPFEEASDKDNLSVDIDTSGIDTSPGQGFAKFNPRHRKPSHTQSHKDKNTTPDSPDKPGTPDPDTMSKTTPVSVLSYTPPAFTLTFDGSTNVKKFFTRFEAYASTFQWDDTVKLAQLIFYLKGPALKCFEQIKRTLSTTLDYDTCKAEMLKYFASKSSPQEFDKKLRERQLMFNETIEQYFWDVIDLVHKVDKKADFDKQRDHVLKGLPQHTANIIWNSKASTLDQLHAAILEQMKFESLMGKQSYASQEQAVNTVVSQLENMGFSVKPPPENKQDVNFAYNNKKKNKKGQKGNFNKSNSRGPSSPQSSQQSQWHPRGTSRNTFNNNRRGMWPSQNSYNNNFNNSWSQKGQFEGYSRRGQYPSNRGFGRQGPQRYNNNFKRFPPRDNYVNMVEHYDPDEFYYEPEMVPIEAVPVRYDPGTRPHNQSVNSFSGNGYW